ncbi:MAG TPA: acyl--CoA ligase [Nitrososphaerales archaeon]|nr:acyl--CoA ligase [Nitrososphaerales archaeon]
MRVRDYPLAPQYLKEFTADVPELFNWGFDVVDRWGREKREGQALVFADDGAKGDSYTFGDVSERSSQLCNYFRSHGIAKGDAVMLMLSNTPMLWLSVVALIKAGAVVVPSATTLTPKDLSYRLSAADIRGVITDGADLKKFTEVGTGGVGNLKFAACAMDGDMGYVPEGWHDLREADSEDKSAPRTPTRADDPAFYYFTSGTEGLPKMVVHTHASYPLGHKETALWLGIEEAKLHWNISSPGWAKHAWSSIFAPWNVGAPTFSYSYRGGFDAGKHLQKLSEFGVHTICAPPTIWRMFVLENLAEFDLSSLKSACSAGEPLNPEVIEKFKKATGLTIRDGYGQTETVLAVGNFPGVEIRQGSMGVPGPLYDIEVVDEDGRALPAGEEGFVAIRLNPRPFALFKEYAKDPEKTKEVFRNGWYYTGDKASKDADGYFWFIGRADDVIKSSGYRIGPFEVESALVKHQSVAEAAVVPAPDPVRGAIVKAYVALKQGYSPSQALADELAAFVAKETGPYKHPRKIEFVKSLEPAKTISGKIRRKNLRLAEYGKADRTVVGEEFTVKPLRGSA